jgi:Phage integrase, N-terminal SAM-like domain
MRDPTDLPTLLQSFFTTRLMMQRKVSPHTIASYRDTFRLLLQFAQTRLRKAPSQMGLDDLDAALDGAFLKDLENRRHNGARSRNLRLTAIRSFFRYASLEAPAHSRIIQRVLGDSEPTTGSRPGWLSDPARDRGAAGGPESNEVAGTPRPRLSPHRRSDRPAIVRDDRVASRGHLARSRRTCALPRKRSQGTLYSSGQTHGRGPESLDPGARQRRFQDAIPQHPRWTFKCRRRSASARAPCGAGPKELRFPTKEKSFTPRASPRRCHGTAASWCGSSGDCAVARS